MSLVSWPPICFLLSDMLLSDLKGIVSPLKNGESFSGSQIDSIYGGYMNQLYITHLANGP